MKEPSALLIGLGTLLTPLTQPALWTALRDTGASLASLRMPGAVMVITEELGAVFTCAYLLPHVYNSVLIAESSQTCMRLQRYTSRYCSPHGSA